MELTTKQKLTQIMLIMLAVNEKDVDYEQALESIKQITNEPSRTITQSSKSKFQ